MNIEQTTLAGGLRIITAALPGFLSASTAVFVQRGSRDETDDTGGIAHFLEHMAFKGTAKRTALQISREVEELGSQINAYTSFETTAYYVNGLGEDVPAALAILGDVLTGSTFEPTELEIERGVILQEISRANDDPMDVAFDGFNAMAYPRQALGRPILGSEDFIRTVQPDHFRAFMAEHYHTGNMIVVGTGNVEHTKFVALVAEHFAAIPQGLPNLRRPARYDGGFSISPKPFEQVTALLGFPGVSDQHPDAFHYKLLAELFGGSMSSPLNQEVREKRGLVYSTGAWTSMGPDHGIVGLHAGTSPKQIVEFFDVACQELLKIGHHTEERDLLRAKNSYLVSYATRRESPFVLGQFIAGSMFLFGRIKLPEERMKEVRAITLEDVRAAAISMLKGRPTIALSGPAPDKDYDRLVNSYFG